MASSTSEASPVTRPQVIPPVAVQPGVDQLDSSVTVPEATVFPRPTFVEAIVDKRKRKMPQCIAHRGFKAQYPENSVLAFQKAVEVGANALELDLHITKDGVIVISHDATLKRCFGRKEKILESNWADIKDLRTLLPPHVPMPRLKDLLEYLARPGMEEIWILLDIKLDNNAEDIMRLLGSTIAEVKSKADWSWSERIVLGLWAAKFLAPAAKYLPGYPVMHIGFKISYARHFSTLPNVGFNMLLPMLMAPGGRGFIRDCQKEYQRQLLVWTVNDTDKMKWCIRRKVDGIITDDPSMFLALCEEFDEHSKEPVIPVGFRSCIEVFRMYIMVTVMFWLFRRKFSPNASPALISRRAQSEEEGLLRFSEDATRE